MIYIIYIYILYIITYNDPLFSFKSEFLAEFLELYL